MTPPPREWHLQIASTPYLISTSPAKLDHAFINASFAHADMYWAKPLPGDALALMLQHSLTLGLYKRSPAAEPSSPRTPSPTLEDPEDRDPMGERWQQIGLARFATDHVSFAYLSDVYIASEHRAAGLGAWLVRCCGEVLDGMPFLRRAILMASEGVGKAYYERVLGMEDVHGQDAGLVCMSRRGPGSALGESGH